jgi:4,4'-diaponeurosporenoate glycosyltransferase
LHRTERAYEQLSAFFNLMMVMGIGAFTVLGDRIVPAGLFGQLLLLDRKSYRLSGGHAAVRGHILENFRLARRLSQAGVAIRCYGGLGTVAMRMYPGGLGDLVEGWRKAFASGAAGVPARLMLPIVAWISALVVCFVMPLLALAGHYAAPAAWLAAYPAACLQVGLMLRRVGRFNPFTWLFYPLPLAFFFWLMGRSALDRLLGRSVSWKGRTIGGGSHAG